MTAADSIRELLDRERFVPFRLVLDSGRQIEVDGPRMAMPLKHEVFIVLPDGDHW